MDREFVEMPTFRNDWSEMGLTEDHLVDLEIELLQNPKIGKVMVGTGGVRKMRYALPGRGKSGGARVIYIDFAIHEKIYLFAAYAKNEQDNMSMAERNEMKLAIAYLEQQLKGGA